MLDLETSLLLHSGASTSAWAMDAQCEVGSRALSSRDLVQQLDAQVLDLPALEDLATTSGVRQLHD